MVSTNLISSKQQSFRQFRIHVILFARLRHFVVQFRREMEAAQQSVLWSSLLCVRLRDQI